MNKDIQKELDEKLYSRNFTKLGLDLNPVVSLAAGLFLFIFSSYALFNLEHASQVFEEETGYLYYRVVFSYLLTYTLLYQN